ncbi:MAG TPA: pentapeptide repeat-containing protein, partial [Capillimicrobium sp.]
RRDPTLLDSASVAVRRGGAQRVRLVDRGARALAATRPGNRVVLTASQHEPTAQVSRTTRTYVTVGELQRFGAPQPRIGWRDCSDTPIRPGAILNFCDLVGADLDGAMVSQHDPKADEGKVPSRSTRLLRADLTGATMVRSEVSGASAAGGRLNGTDLTRAKLDNLSLAGAEARGLIARGATSDAEARDSGANLFAARLDGADLRDTVLNGVSFGRATLDEARLQGARWAGVFADQASLRGADLTGAAVGPGSSFYFADARGADLAGSDLSDPQLRWALLCRTALPPASRLDAGRDCRTGPEEPTVPAPDPDDGRSAPWVRIAPAAIDGGRDGARTVRATIAWDAASRSTAGYGMYVGDLRLVAIGADTGRPRVIDSRTVATIPAAAVTEYELEVTGRADLAAMAQGNRVVLTATQHPPPARSGRTTARSYVTVATLQRGPRRGRVGMYDCSRIAVVADSVRRDGLEFCDLAGATLTTAAIGARTMRDADLTGATLAGGAVTAVVLDGASLAGLDASGAVWRSVTAIETIAPALTLSDGVLSASRVLAADLADLDLRRAKLYETTTFAASPMRRARLTGATLDHTDLAFADLRGAELDVVTSESNSSLFLADLTRATLADSTWTVDEAGEPPWTWATLCATTMPPRSVGIDGDRDCPR